MTEKGRIIHPAGVATETPVATRWPPSIRVFERYPSILPSLPTQKIVRRQNIWLRLGLRLAEFRPHHGVDIKCPSSEHLAQIGA